MTHFTLAAFRTDLDSAFPASSSSASAPSSSSRQETKPFEESCTFCAIASGKQPAHTVYEDQDTIAFLDILPLRPGALAAFS
jgi:hypothetical protein